MNRKGIYSSFIIFLLIGSIAVQINFVTSTLKPESSEFTIKSNTYNLKKIGHFLGGDEIVDVEIIDNFALIADQKLGLLIVNISDIKNPTLYTSYQDEANSVYDVQIIDSTIYLAHGRAGLKILDFSDSETLDLLGEYNDGGIAWKVHVVDNIVYLSDRVQGLEIIDCSDKNSPVKIGLYSGQPFDVIVREKYAYIAAGINKGLEIVDISDPTNPKKVGETESNFQDTVSVTLKDNYAFISQKSAGMKVVRITRARNPKVIAEYNDFDGGNIWSIFIEDNFAYIAAETKGVYILDITNLDEPFKVGHYYNTDSGKTFNVVSKDELVYSADFEDGLKILSWKTTKPIPFGSDYVIIDETSFNFNHSVGPFDVEAILGNETVGLNLSLFLDIGLMSPINVTVSAPRIISPGDIINLIVNISAEDSYFWGHFEGTIEFTTPVGSSDLFSLEEAGIPKHVTIDAFRTFIGESIELDDLTYPIELWSQTILNNTVSLVMTPFLNTTGSAIISANVQNNETQYNFAWTEDNDQVIIPIKIPETAEDFYAIPINDFQFEIDDLVMDLYYISFDVVALGLPVYSWEINISSFNLLPLELAYENSNPIINQPTNQTIIYLNGIYPLGEFIVFINFTNGGFPIWAVLLTLFGLIALIVTPWALIITVMRRNRKEDEENLVE